MRLLLLQHVQNFRVDGSQQPQSGAGEPDRFSVSGSQLVQTGSAALINHAPLPEIQPAYGPVRPGRPTRRRPVTITSHASQPVQFGHAELRFVHVYKLAVSGAQLVQLGSVDLNSLAFPSEDEIMEALLLLELADV